MHKSHQLWIFQSLLFPVGYIVLFGSAFPLAFAVAWATNILDLHLDFEAKYGGWGVVLAGFVLYCSTLTAEYFCYLLGRHKLRATVQRKVNANPELHFLRSLDRLIVEGEGVNMVMLLRLAPLPKGPAN